MYQKSKYGSRLHAEDNRQGQSRSNYYDQQSQQEFSPPKRKGPSKQAPNKRTQQIADRIQDVIQLCVGDRNEGTDQFQEVMKAERGILDLLVNSEIPEVNIPGYTGGGFASHKAGAEAGKGSRPFLDINAQSPVHRDFQQGTFGQGQRIAEDPYALIEEIEKKALIEIEGLRRERSDLIQRLNDEVRLHNDERRRRAWCENQLKRMMAFLQQQGIQVGPIQYPPWYHQSSVQQIDQSQHPGSQSQFQNAGFGLPTQSKIGLQQQNLDQNAPSFPNQFGGQGQQYPQSVNQNQASQHTHINQLSQSAYDPQSAFRPRSPSAQQVNSTYQIASSNQQGNPGATNPFQQGGSGIEGSYQNRPEYDGGYYSQQGGQTGQGTFGYSNQQGTLGEGLGGLRNQIEHLKQNMQNVDNPNDIYNLQQRLIAAEQRARQYQQEAERWKLSASRKGGEYPGLAELLQQAERIRRETIKLLRLKETGQLGGGNYSAGFGGNQENYQQKSYRQGGGKGSFETNVLSPKSEYQQMLDEMKRITKG